jgi:hypothetical protein
MAEWQKEWQNGRMAGMATYALFMVHTNDTDTTLIFYSIDDPYWQQDGAEASGFKVSLTLIMTHWVTY